MPAATVLRRHMVALAPMKAEFFLIDSPATGDTFETNMIRPLYAIATQAETTTEIANASASVSGRTVTIGTNGSGEDLFVLVVGF